MIADRISFVLARSVSISIGQDGHVMLLAGDDCTYIQDTNFGKFLLQGCRGASAQQSVDQFRWSSTSGTIQ
jgi:hypothetical protein